MVLCVKLKKANGERVKIFLKSKGWLDAGYKIGKTMNYLFVPASDKSNFDLIQKQFPDASIENRNLQKTEGQHGDLKSLLEKVLPSSAVKDVVASFDIIGDIAVTEIPDHLKKHEVAMAWTLKRFHTNVNVVAKKDSITKGKYRIRKIKVLVGDKRTETVHRESGVRLKTDLNKAYFSPRLGTDRSRIANLVKKNENILIMFAGVGPYALVIAKKNPDVKITGIEINKDAVGYFKENLKLNKNIYADKKYAPLGKKALDRIKNTITILQGDVNTVIPKIKEKFDRILMPLPQTAHEYLDLVRPIAKKNATVHLYHFCRKDHFKEDAKKVVPKWAKLISINKCGAYAPYVYRVCIDMKVI